MAMDKVSESSISASNRCENRIAVLQSSENLLIRDNSPHCSVFSFPHHHIGHLHHSPPSLLPLASPKWASHHRTFQRKPINAKDMNLSRKDTSKSSSFYASPNKDRSDFSEAKQLAALHSTRLGASLRFGHIGGEDTSLSICLVSPHPSSLPLPKFSLLPKIKSGSCKAEALDGIDAGATDDLRRLLRLQGVSNVV